MKVDHLNILLKFKHGLGDAVQFTIVLRHLKKYNPNWTVDVACLYGKHTAVIGHCNRVILIDKEKIDESKYDRVIDIGWWECYRQYKGMPSTKVELCLDDVFNINADPSISDYVINYNPSSTVLEYLEHICRGKKKIDNKYPVALIHYQGNSSSDNKNIPHDIIDAYCSALVNWGIVPVIFDWDKRSSIPNDKTIFCPNVNNIIWNNAGTGDAATILNLIDLSCLFVGIDSGPQKVAGASKTPSIGLWTKHHPINYFTHASNMTHLVPTNHEHYIHGSENGAIDFFKANYKYKIYNNLAESLLSESYKTIFSKEMSENAYILMSRSRSYDINYYDQHRKNGLDYASYGEWQKKYTKWMMSSFKLNSKKLLDVGCACGSILRGFRENGVNAYGIDINEEMVNIGRQKWPDLSNIIKTCDAINIHYFEPNEFDFIHCSQVAEHWKSELVPFILKELARVTKPGGLFFCCMDTQELFTERGKPLSPDDPSHACIKPRTWWHSMLPAAGWQLCTDEFDKLLREHNLSYLKTYNWHYFIARKVK